MKDIHELEAVLELSRAKPDINYPLQLDLELSYLRDVLASIEVQKMKTVAFYPLLSTVDQHPETQLHDLRAMAQQRGLQIYAANFSALEAAGCGVHIYPNTQTGFYVHAKAVIADYDLATQKVYMGSINYSNASMTQNREPGVYITDPASIHAPYTAMTSQYAGASPY
jgi:PLD-like domain